MAALNYNVCPGEITLAASAVRSAIVLTAPASQRVKVKGLSVYAKGISNTDTPVKVELMLAASVTSGTSSAIVPTVRDGDISEIPRSTINTYTAEPTYGTLTQFETRECHPQIGIEIYFPLGDEIILKSGQILVVRLTVNQSETLVPNLLIEE